MPPEAEADRQPRSGSLRREMTGRKALPVSPLIDEERDRILRALLERHGFWPLGAYDVLEIGCGGGGQLARLLDWGAKAERLHGIDVQPERVSHAKTLCPAIDFQAADGREFSLGPASIDLVMLFTVLSSIRDDATILAIVDRIREMLRPSGGVVWYDFFIKNPRNQRTRPMRRRDIAAFFPDFTLELDKITVFPPLVRALGRLSWLLYPYLTRVPLLRGHYIGILRRSSAPDV
jgi:SAM-dependent methyltransferase